MRLSILFGGALVASAAASVALAAPVSSVAVKISPELQAKAGKRTSRYDQRDLDYLSRELQRNIERRAGVSPDGDRIEVTITDLKPNRPTFWELSERPGLSALSPSIGGAKLEGVRISADGQRTPLNFQRYDIDLINSMNFGLTPWATAQNTFSGYARKIAQN